MVVVEEVHLQPQAEMVVQAAVKETAALLRPKALALVLPIKVSTVEATAEQVTATTGKMAQAVVVQVQLEQANHRHLEPQAMA
jgi:hypothetical protein